MANEVHYKSKGKQKMLFTLNLSGSIKLSRCYSKHFFGTTTFYTIFSHLLSYWR